MTILILERVSPSLRGDLSRWLLEVQSGVFVGKVNEVVREALWERAMRRVEDGSALLLWRTNSEQGFEVRSWQPKRYVLFCHEGVWLVRRPSGEET